MKAKNYLFFRSQSKALVNPSILESSFYMVDLLVKLSNEFEDFSRPIYYHPNKSIPINLNNNLDELSKLLATQILNKEWNEITKFEGNKKPTIEYKRELGTGFSGWFSFVDDKNTKLFDCSIGVGYSSNGIVISSQNKNILFEYSWYEEVLKSLTRIMSSEYSFVRVSYPSFNDMYKEFNLPFPLGWLTYYSNELEITIPELPNVSVVPYLNGTLIKTDVIDFLESKESFDAYKSRLGILLEKFMELNQSTT
jgi:hypothetical protein